MTRILPPGPVDLSWDHNSHYHGHLLRQVPSGRSRALDVGCGDGRFARVVAQRGLTVDAVDASADMVELARARTPSRLPMRDPETSLREIGAAAARHLPGAHLRRLLMWRYSLVYTRPE